MLKIKTKLTYSTNFKPVSEDENDFRYKISPKKETQFFVREYIQVFNSDNKFVHGLSIIDLIFNMGPEASGYL
jgi:hypothetical protein